MKGVYLLQMDDDTPSEDTFVNDPSISLNVITGLAATDTMQLAVRVVDQILEALIDPGFTHSFISTSVIARLHLEPLHQPGLHVKVTNGDRVSSAGICRTLRIFIDSDEFVVDLFIIPMEGYDMLLSVQWLSTLGLILWDFDQAHMCYWRDDHHVEWQGMTTHHTFATVHTLATPGLMTLLLQDFEDVFATPTTLPLPQSPHPPAPRYPDDGGPALPLPTAGEGQVGAPMLGDAQQGIIRPSASAFSSAVLLVKKHDGT
jgi:hypothetical protein